MPVGGRAEVDSIPGAGVLSISRDWIFMSLYIAPKSTLAMLGIIQCFLVYNLSGTEVLGNPTLGRKVVGFPGALNHKGFHNELG